MTTFDRRAPRPSVTHDPASDRALAAVRRSQAALFRAEGERYLALTEVALPALTDDLVREFAEGIAARYSIHHAFCLSMADKADVYADDLERHAQEATA